NFVGNSSTGRPASGCLPSAFTPCRIALTARLAASRLLGAKNAWRRATSSRAGCDHLSRGIWGERRPYPLRAWPARRRLPRRWRADRLSGNGSRRPARPAAIARAFLRAPHTARWLRASPSAATGGGLRLVAVDVLLS